MISLLAKNYCLVYTNIKYMSFLTSTLSFFVKWDFISSFFWYSSPKTLRRKNQSNSYPLFPNAEMGQPANPLHRLRPAPLVSQQAAGQSERRHHGGNGQFTRQRHLLQHCRERSKMISFDSVDLNPLLKTLTVPSFCPVKCLNCMPDRCVPVRVCNTPRIRSHVSSLSA